MTDIIKGLPARLSDPEDNDITWDGSVRVLALDRREDGGEWNPGGTIAELQLIFDDGHIGSVQLNVGEASALDYLLKEVVREALEYQGKYHPIPLPEGVQAFTVGGLLDAVERGDIKLED